MDVLAAKIDAFGDSVIAWALQGSPVTPLPSPEAYPLASLSSAVAIVVCYFTFILFGSLFMKTFSKDGIKLYGVAFTYNIIQVMLCSYMCIEGLMIAYRNGYSVVCNHVDMSSPPMSNLLYLFYVSKVLDFFDTFFIVLGKKWKQLSFLHVYHHSTIFLVYWLNLHVNYDGDVYLTIVLNGTIHTMMYTYYFVSMHTREIWWKKFLTLAQLVQFVGMNAQAIYLLATGCSPSPWRVTACYLVYIMTLFALFLQFFVASYLPKKKKQ
ncbi:ELO family [Pelagophyceae sp. CCMP2097]|nr:ELO family [Pelagophyceae sp. CCMP2097]